MAVDQNIRKKCRQQSPQLQTVRKKKNSTLEPTNALDKHGHKPHGPYTISQ